MKLKMLLLTIFAAGLTASLAFADGNKPHDNGPACNPVHLEGTIAPQSLTMTVTHAGSDIGEVVAAGSQVTLAVGTTRQTVRVNVDACSIGSAATLQLTIKLLQLHPITPPPTARTTPHCDHHPRNPN